VQALLYAASGQGRGTGGHSSKAGEPVEADEDPLLGALGGCAGGNHPLQPGICTGQTKRGEPESLDLGGEAPQLVFSGWQFGVCFLFLNPCLSNIWFHA
jgi:hypothetical protein